MNIVNTELGQCFMKKNSVIAIKKCLHPAWGLLWTDGGSVYLLPMSSENISSQDHSTQLHLKSFGKVLDLCWSSTVNQEAYVTVINIQETQLFLTLWKPSRTKTTISFTQVYCKELDGAYIFCNPEIIWHPYESKFCLMTQALVEIYSFEDNDVNRLYRHSLEKGSFTCASWSHLGSFIMLGTQSKLMCLKIPADDSIPIALALGRVCAVESINKDKILCTVALPLDSVITSQNTLAFGYNDADLDTSDNSKGCLETLMNVASDMQCPINASSKLILLDWNNTARPCAVASVNIPRILTPNLLAWEEESSICAVGSNNSSTVFFFKVSNNILLYYNELVLHHNNHSKGIVMHNKKVWIMESKLLDSLSSLTMVLSKDYLLYSVSLSIIPLNNLLKDKMSYIPQQTVNHFHSQSSPTELTASVKNDCSSAISNLSYQSHVCKTSKCPHSASYCCTVSNIDHKMAGSSKDLQSAILKQQNAYIIVNNVLETEISPTASDNTSDESASDTIKSCNQNLNIKECKIFSANNEDGISCQNSTSKHHLEMFSIPQQASKHTDCSNDKQSNFECLPDIELNSFQKYLIGILNKQQQELQEIKHEVTEIRRLVTTLTSHSLPSMGMDIRNSKN